MFDKLWSLLKAIHYDQRGGSGTAVATGDVITAAKMNLKLETIVDADLTHDSGDWTVGEDGAGQDIIYYTDTAGRVMTWDPSDSSLELDDNVIIAFGDDDDVEIYWNATSLLIVPLTNDVGSIQIGDGDAKSMDVLWYGGTTDNWVKFDLGADKVQLEAVDLHLGDTDLLILGDGSDITIQWTSALLTIIPATDDTGAINIGDGTTDIDLKIFLGSATEYVDFNVGDSKVTMALVPLAFTGAYLDDCIDFTNVAINHTGADGPALLRAGTYDSPLSNADEDQSGLIRFYTTTSADGVGYDRGIFVCQKTTGLKAVFPIAGLAEIKAQSGDGPTTAMAAQFITMLQDATSKLAAIGASTHGMYAAWLKVGAVEGAITASGSRVAAVWLDNQLNGSGISSGMEEYAAFITCGGSKPDAVFGFETTSSGWANLFLFDETSYDHEPLVAADITTGDKDYYLKCSLNGVGYGIQLYKI